MKFIDLIHPDHIILRLQATEKSQLLGELAKRAASRLALDHAAVASALMAREQLGSTGVGRGVALPHARLAGLGAPFTLFVRLARPIEFDAVDGRPVDIVVLILTSPDSDQHVAAMAAVARAMRDEAMVREVRNARTATALYEHIVSVAAGE